MPINTTEGGQQESTSEFITNQAVTCLLRMVWHFNATISAPN